MNFEYTISERRSMAVLVRAKDEAKAQKIFDEWYDRHSKLPIEGGDGLVDEILENNAEGRVVRKWTLSESTWPEQLVDIILPEEEEKPPEPLFNVSFRFADGGEPIIFREQTLPEVGNHMAMFGKKYYLFPDRERVGIFSEGCEKHSDESWFDLYAVPKDDEDE